MGNIKVTGFRDNLICAGATWRPDEDDGSGLNSEQEAIDDFGRLLQVDVLGVFDVKTQTGRLIPINGQVTRKIEKIWQLQIAGKLPRLGEPPDEDTIALLKALDEP